MKPSHTRRDTPAIPAAHGAPLPSLPPKAMLASALVLEMSGLVVGGLLLGAWLDGRLGTAPILLALLPFVGLVGGVWRIIRVLEARREREP